MKRTFLVKKDPTIEAQDNWLIMDYRQYAAWRETDEGKNREIVFGKFEACSEDDSIIFMECNEKVSKELKKDCHRKQYIRSRDAETPFQVMSYAGLADIGVGSRTVEKAKKELQVTTYRSGGSWYWSLPKPK